MANKSTKLKYPPKVVLKEMKVMLKELKEDEEIIFIGTLFKDKEYTRYTIDKIINRFKKKLGNKVLKQDPDYSKIQQIVLTKKKIAETLEARIVTKQGINPVFKMFLLKCCHKWIEEEKKLGLKINIKQESTYTLNIPQQINANQLGNKPIEIGEDGSIKPIE